ncbi:MAG: ATP-binding protein [Rhodocyclaceae bacterium]|nr:ATP-binding protein [Rhodocyclaceae bacterium]
MTSNLNRSGDGAQTLASLRRLIAARWYVLIVAAVIILSAPALLAIPLTALPLLAIVAVAALFNGFAWLRHRTSQAASAAELFRQICIDLATLAALMFFTGGATNPLISLLLPSVAFAALTLPRAYVVAVTGLAISIYSALMVAFVPLPIESPGRAAQLHLSGMWLTFVVSAALIAWFILRMMATIRERDAALAAARERALRDEHLVALGTLAAGAAHELGTPLATMAVIAGELERDTTLSEATRADFDILRNQIAACKTILTGLTERAGVRRLEKAAAVAVDVWIAALHLRWRQQLKHCTSRIEISGQPPAPEIIADPSLEQGVINLLNNSVNATSGAADEIVLGVRWDTTTLWIEVRDLGPGFSPEVLQQAGRKPFPANFGGGGGSGIGLLLTQGVIERLGGSLLLSSAAGGGGIARIELPLVKISP